MSNIFSGTKLKIFTALSEFVDTFMGEIAATSTVLYIYLNKRACDYGQPIVRIHTGDVLSKTGMSRKTLLDARNDLIANSLIRARLIDTRGTWEYEVLDPVTKGSLPVLGVVVDFALLPDKIILNFYGQHLNGFDGNNKFTCPFHYSSKRKPTFAVKLKQGDPKHASWMCSHCQKSGGLVSFLQIHKSLRRDQAAWEVKTSLQSIAGDKVGHFDAGEQLPDVVLPEDEIADESTLDDTPF
jgi:hypothetical protein